MVAINSESSLGTTELPELTHDGDIALDKALEEQTTTSTPPYDHEANRSEGSAGLTRVT